MLSKSPSVRFALVAGCLTVSVAFAAEPAREAPAATSAPQERREDGGVSEGASDAKSESDAQREKLEEEIEALREELEELRQRVDPLAALRGRFTGYVDFGAFLVTGDGSGIRTDLGYRHFPEFRNDVPDSWVFYGDPLATAVNARGEPANTSESRAITFNPINNGGKASFLVNALNFALFSAIGDVLTLNAMIDFVPRGRDVADPGGLFLGDFLDVKLAYAELLLPFDTFTLNLYAGKFDSLLGIEYRSQEAPDRLGVTPSLICRYTCGRPIGLKARAAFFEEALTVMGSVSNGSHFTELFPFYNEVDKNHGKTAAARIAYRLPIGAGLELGASGAFGTQDNQPREDVPQWHYGFDLRLDAANFDVRGEFVKGRAEGRRGGAVPCDDAACLSYRGAYLLVGYRLSNVFTPYLRADWRDAWHRDGRSFVYISQLWRGTAGVRAEIGTNVVLKAEAILVDEIGRVPDFANDVFTSSLSITY